MADVGAGIEVVARAIWTRMVELQDDPERGQCWSMPLETPRGPTTPWELSEGAWHTQMLELAHAALDAVRSSGAAAQEERAIINARWAGKMSGRASVAEAEVARLTAELEAARSPQDEDHEETT